MGVFFLPQADLLAENRALRRDIAAVKKSLVEYQAQTGHDTMRLAAITELEEDAMVSTAVDGSILSWNPAAERLYGYSANEAIGKPIAMVCSSGTVGELHEIMERLKQGERVLSFETKRRHKDGRELDVVITISSLLDAEGRMMGALKITRDITEKKQLEEQLRQCQKMEAIGQLAGGVAHDFNNLLTIILGYSQVAIENLAARHPVREYLQMIQEAGDRATALTEQLLAFSRKSVLQCRIVDLNAVVSDCEKMLRRLVGEDVEIACFLMPSLWQVMADASQVEQMILNLAVNARDAMPEGGKLTLKTANVEVDDTYCMAHHDLKPGSYVLLTVSDNGCGMDRQTQLRIFEPFFTTKETGRGTGLGLAMVYGFIRQTGGHIAVSSVVGRGTTFRIFLPRTEEARASPKPGPSQVLLRGNETILVVEDDDGVRTLTRNVLHACGYNVFEAGVGEDAIRLAESRPEAIDLLLTDLVMPSMSGVKLAERLYAVQPAMKVIFMSGYTDDTIMRHGILNADCCVIEKPFTPHALSQKVREVLDEQGGSISLTRLERFVKHVRESGIGHSVCGTDSEAP